MRKTMAVCGLDELLEIAPALADLQTFLSSPVGQLDWILASAEYLGQESLPFVFVAYDDKQPVALVSLVRKEPFSTYRQFQTFEPVGFCYRDADALQGLTDLMAARGMPVFLERIPDDPILIRALKKSYRGRALMIVKESDSCPYIDIEGGADQMIASLSARLRSDLRRAARKADGQGGAACFIHAPTAPEEVDVLWEKALAVEAAGWKGRSGSALSLDRQYGSFLYGFARRACTRGMLRINFLEIGGQAAATEIALVGGNRYWLLKIGYDEHFAKCSPGMLLMEQTLRYAADLGLQSYEFMGSAADWTRRWTEKERGTYSVRTYPYNLRGAMLLTGGLVAHIFRKLRPGAIRGEKTEEAVKCVST